MASGEAVEHIVGDVTGDGSDGISGRMLIDYNKACERVDDLPVVF